jgi:metal-responsive CopG/Arc/MetJ family transcriptional regulator
MGMEGETARVRVTIPRELVASVDELVGKPNRGAFIVEAVADKMKRERLGGASVVATESLPAKSHPESDAPEKPSA